MAHMIDHPPNPPPPKFETEPYKDTADKWPAAGKHILAQFTDDAILVYQAFKPSITEYAVKHGHFGGTEYNTKRMTWIKTSFLWMMFRSNWGSKKSQDSVVGIWIKHDAFERILEKAVRKLSRGEHKKKLKHATFEESDDDNDDENDGDNYNDNDNAKLDSDELSSEKKNNKDSNDTKVTNDKKEKKGEHVERFVVRLQWDPDHYPDGSRHYRRRAIQLGVRGWTGFVDGDDIVAIQDISEFVSQQRKNAKKPELLQVPKERVYTPTNPNLSRLLELDHWP